MYWYTLSLPVPVPVCVIVRGDDDIAVALGLAEVDEETGIGFLVDERIAGGVVAQAVAEDLRGAMFLVEGDIEQRAAVVGPDETRSEEHTSELQSLMRISYAVFCMQKKKKKDTN